MTIKEQLEDLALHLQMATEYADRIDEGYTFIAHINSLGEELEWLKEAAAEHENVRLRTGILEFKPLRGWDDDDVAPGADDGRM